MYVCIKTHFNKETKPKNKNILPTSLGSRIQDFAWNVGKLTGHCCIERVNIYIESGLGVC